MTPRLLDRNLTLNEEPEEKDEFLVLAASTLAQMAAENSIRLIGDTTPLVSVVAIAADRRETDDTDF